MPENEETITMKNENEVDPEGLPLDRRMKQNDQVTETSSGLEVTSPNALSGRPSGFMVGSTAPGASEAPQVAVESVKSPKQSAIPEYRAPASRLPDTISAREIYNDRSNPDGCVSGEVQR
jgi:hypothetical protein